MVRFVLAVVLGGLVAFAFAFVFIMFMPWRSLAVRSLPGDEAVMKALAENVPEPGVYLFPAFSKDGTPPTMEDLEAWDSRARTGPAGLIYFARNGLNVGGPELPLGLGFHFLGALIATTLLRLATPSLPRYLARVLFVGSLGLFAAVPTFLTLLSLGFATPGAALANTLNVVVGWLFAGLVIAAFIRPTPATHKTS